MTATPPIGSRVLYAGAPYVVTIVNGDLLTLDGITTIDRNGYGRCRPRCTVLAGDVTVCASQCSQEAHTAPERSDGTQNTQDADGGYL